MIGKLFFLPGGLLVFCLVSLVVARMMVARAAKNKTYSDAEFVPQRRAGLVLGCPKRTSSGWPNPFFENRIAAAAELYHRGKVEYLLVSGNKHLRGDDEPTDMQSALLEKEVPASRIHLDYAGLRTLDSVVRAKEVFGQDRITIISQKFHNQRAIFLASHCGIDAIGFNAPEVALQNSLKTRLREQFAKVKAVLDVYFFRTHERS